MIRIPDRRLVITVVLVAGACAGDDGVAAGEPTSTGTASVGPTGSPVGDATESTAVPDATAASSNGVADTTTVAAGSGTESTSAATGAQSSGGSESTGAAMMVSFFVTSEGNGAAGGNYGGLAGADARCQSLADEAGLGGRTWRAYLSQAEIDGAALVHARDRIGSGPWRNAASAIVAEDLDALHSDGLDPTLALDETGQPAGKGPPPGPEHDIITGSNPDGTSAGAAMTCRNWTSNDAEDDVRVGHHDWSAIENPITTPQNFNSVHPSPCDAAGMASVLGSGRLYCFAP